MKKISILLISILLIILNLTTIYADEISIEELYNDKSKAMINTNEYDAYKIYDSSTKVIIDDNQVVPDGANILLFDKDKKKIISIDKNLRDYYKRYELIGYEVNNIPFIYKSYNDLLYSLFTSISKRTEVLFISIILLSIIAFFISKIIEKSFEYRY